MASLSQMQDRYNASETKKIDTELRYLMDLQRIDFKTAEEYAKKLGNTVCLIRDEGRELPEWLAISFLRYGLDSMTELELWNTAELSRGGADATFDEYVEHLKALEASQDDKSQYDAPRDNAPQDEAPQTATKPKRKKIAEDVSSSGDTDADVIDDESKQAKGPRSLQRKRSKSGKDSLKKLTQTPGSGTKPSVEESAQPVQVQVQPQPERKDVRTTQMASLHPALEANYVFAIAGAFGGFHPSQALVTEDVQSLPKRSVMTTIIDGAVQKFQLYHLKRYWSMKVAKLPELILEAHDLKELATITQASYGQVLERIQSFYTNIAQNETMKNFLDSCFADVIKVEVRRRNSDEADKAHVRAITVEMLNKLMPTEQISKSTAHRMQLYWSLLSQMRQHGALFVVLYRSKAANRLLMDDTRNKLTEADIVAWAPEIQRIHNHLEQHFKCIDPEYTPCGAQEEAAAKIIRYPSDWGSLIEQTRWEKRTGRHTLNATSVASLLRYGFRAQTTRNKSWGVMRRDSGVSVAIAEIPEGCFLGVVPGTIRSRPIRPVDSIPGAHREWLDVQGCDGALAGIKVGAPDLVNVMLAWDMVGDTMAPMHRTTQVVAFSIRPISMHQELVRYDCDGRHKTTKPSS